MAVFVAGEASEIKRRLKREGRSVEVVELQFISAALVDGTPGWCPCPSADFFPIAPGVGDTVMVKSFYCVGKEEGDDQAPRKVGEKFWRIVQRSILQSGPPSKRMTGILVLFVEPADDFWTRSMEDKGEEESA